jgi:hypothetical protein
MRDHFETERTPGRDRQVTVRVDNACTVAD